MIHLKLDDLIVDVRDTMNFQRFSFNGGERHICLASQTPGAVIIEASLTNSDSIMDLFMATDALRREGYDHVELFIPYLPYGRQDRVCNPGEALSVRVMTWMINAQGYNRVYTLDNHSDVSTALLNNHCEINKAAIIKRLIPNVSEYALVSPDAGALKKTYALSKKFGGIPVIECSKKRDVKNGQIIGVEINEVKNKLKWHNRLLIVDDICDGGRTFIEVAKEIKKYTETPIDLYVSHGIFSQGVDVFKGLIDKVYTTKSFLNGVDVYREPFLITDIR